ncbi:MAG: hypothetical protein IPP47_09145 [Bryobacterales bacterium]|nr:hypothetical protein [Bryobacterales bacterium]
MMSFRVDGIGMARLWIAGIWLALTLGAQEPTEYPTTQRPVRPESQGEDPGRPVLKRGGPAQKREEVAPPPAPTPPAAPAKTPTPTTAKSPVREVTVDENGNAESVVTSGPVRYRKGTDELIERAREAAYEFNEKLPNFICDQITSRYESKTLKPDWKYKDRIQLELVYQNGKEDYRNIRMNNKPVKKGGPEDSGTWSSGEFGTMLMDVFATNTAAYFVPRGDSTAAGLAAKVYDYSVRQENSHWQIRFSRTVMPAYKGAAWIDPKTARVLRLEMNTRQLPKNFEIDDVETIVDYGWVTLSGQKYLLPMKSENLSCQRDTFNCTKNEIEFRNYRKFQVESQILQVDSDIVFPEEEDPKKPASKTTPPSITPEPPKAEKKKQ